MGEKVLREGSLAPAAPGPALLVLALMLEPPSRWRAAAAKPARAALPAVR